VGKTHRLALRRQAILNALEKAGQLSVKELSQRFDVSEVTIRADLQALSEQNLLLRTRGGGLSIGKLPELSFDVRQQQQGNEKARIGKAAAQLIRSGSTIALDASTTAIALLSHLDQASDIQIITNSLKVAMNSLRLRNVQVFVIGGLLRRDSISLVSPSNHDLPRNLQIETGFFGARGLTIQHGLMDVHLEEVRIKRRMVQSCQRVVGVFDSLKWGQVATATFAHLEQVDTIITDSDAPVDLVAQVRDAGVDVQLV
jgi:DeoR/GlpR family transcriptional regulator of sugar metabolism